MTLKTKHKRHLFVGLGSPHGDDRLGWQAAELLQQVIVEDGSDLEIRTAASPADLLGWLANDAGDNSENWTRLDICDACHGLGEVGQWRRYVWPSRQLLPESFAGTHDLSLVQVLTLAERLQLLPPETIVWAIEGEMIHQPSDASASSANFAAINAATEVIHAFRKERQHA